MGDTVKPWREALRESEDVEQLRRIGNRLCDKVASTCTDLELVQLACSTLALAVKDEPARMVVLDCEPADWAGTHFEEGISITQRFCTEKKGAEVDFNYKHFGTRQSAEALQYMQGGENYSCTPDKMDSRYAAERFVEAGICDVIMGALGLVNGRYYFYSVGRYDRPFTSLERVAIHAHGDCAANLISHALR